MGLVQCITGLQRGKLAPTVVSGLGVVVPSWPRPVLRLHHESSLETSLEISSASYIIARVSWIEVVYGR